MKRMRSLSRAAQAGLVGAALLMGSAALAQQPAPQPAPQIAPRPVQPIQMPGGLPGGHPPIQPGPGGMQPPPGFPPGGARPLPPGFNPHGGLGVPAGGSAHGAAASASHEKPEHCPGHGPMDAPHHPNWWHGLLMVNNKRALEGGFLNTLLFRYNDEANPCDERNEPPPFLASLLNFGLLCFVIYRFGKKPVGEALAKRKQSIMHEIDTATRLLEEAEARLVEYETKFEKIDETLSELKAELALQAEVEKKHVLAEAEERRARMKRDAQHRVEQELAAAKAELLEAAVENAVHAAEELLKKSAGTQDQDRIMREYLSAVPAALKGGEARPSAGAAGGQS